MKRILLALGLVLVCAKADASVLYQQPPHASGGFYLSSWWDPDGSNYDNYVWDKFVLASAADIDSVAWRGAYDPAPGGGGSVVNFTVAIYGSIPGGSQPDLSGPPLVEYEVGDNAGEAYAGVLGGVTMYAYRYELPVAFHALAGVPYWVQIEGWQLGFPDWGIARGTGGDNYHFRCEHNNFDSDGGVPTGCWFTAPSGDTAFSLLTAAATDVSDTQVSADLVLSGSWPNPSRGDRLEISFSLPSSAPAELVLFDVCGRQVVREEIGGFGAGRHVANLAARAPVDPGIYFARLSQGGEVRLVKVVVAE